MSAPDFPAIAEAFSRKAQVYDTFGEDHPNLARMRARVRAQVERFLMPGARLLELNAGTGGDAVYFARRGHTVLATDISPGMVAEIRAKAAAGNFGEALQVRQVSFTELDQLDAPPFDLVFSNMGGLNCISDLRAVTRHLPGLLKPAGVVVFVIMPPICPWEWGGMIRGDWRASFRRLTPGGVMASVEGVRFRTFYFSPSRVARAFGDGFARAGLASLSLFTPPADRKNFARRFPRLYGWLAAVDDRLAGVFPFNHWGDFFILSMRRLP
jgi:SAM-dependent methyltransferase